MAEKDIKVGDQVKVRGSVFNIKGKVVEIQTRQIGDKLKCAIGVELPGGEIRWWDKRGLEII